MSQSQKQILRVPSSANSKTHLRKNVRQFSKTSFKQISHYEDKPQMKFKQIKEFNSFRTEENDHHINELEMKYHVYNHGSPNFYTNSIQAHKANILKNSVKSLDLPFIDGVIQQIRNNDSKQNSTNFRNYQLYPNSLKNHLSHKFKDFLSDKQQLKDFLQWFNTNCSLIRQKNISQMKKFQQKQIIVSSAFSEIIQQLTKLSKTRSQIIKLLWNKQAQEVEQIVKHLTNKVMELQRQHLIESSQTHAMYQRQIDILQFQNQQLSQKLKRQTFLNEGYINTFRINRKLIKKQQFGLKKLFKLNQSIVKENLNLIEINTQLLLNQSQNKVQSQQQHSSGTLKTLKILQKNQSNQTKQKPEQLKYVEAKVIIYRKLQIEAKRSSLKKNLSSIKNHMLHELKMNSIKQVTNNELSEFQLEDIKTSLYNYLLNRVSENSGERLLIGDDFLHEDDNERKSEDVESAIKKILDSKNVQNYLKTEQVQSC